MIYIFEMAAILENPGWKVPTFSYFSGFFLLFPTLGSIPIPTFSHISIFI